MVTNLGSLLASLYAMSPYSPCPAGMASPSIASSVLPAVWALTATLSRSHAAWYDPNLATTFLSVISVAWSDDSHSHTHVGVPWNVSLAALNRSPRDLTALGAAASFAATGRPSAEGRALAAVGGFTAGASSRGISSAGVALSPANSMMNE